MNMNIFLRKQLYYYGNKDIDKNLKINQNELNVRMITKENKRKLKVKNLYMHIYIYIYIHICIYI
jgi:hypothetical protein